MTRGGILASGTAAVLLVVGALVSAGGSAPTRRPRRKRHSKPREMRRCGPGSVMPGGPHVMDPNSTRWGRYVTAKQQDARASSPVRSRATPPKALSSWPIETGEAHALLAMSWARPAEPISRVMSVPIFRRLAVQAVRMNTSSTTFTTAGPSIRRR